jgi:YD repeat-containing protein
MSQPFSRRGLLGALATGLLCLFGRKPVVAASLPKSVLPSAPSLHSLLTSTTDPLGLVTTSTYDACGRLIGVQRSGPNHEGHGYHYPA